ncbi:MAG: HEAT repeat domain-containing protein [Candidatus Eisenbacteria bacterium]
MECAVSPGRGHRRLRELARDGEAETRCRAVRVLKNSQEPSTLALLSGALHDPEPVVRIAAAEALADQGGARALEPLLRVLVGKENSISRRRRASASSSWQPGGQPP